MLFQQLIDFFLHGGIVVSGGSKSLPALSAVTPFSGDNFPGDFRSGFLAAARGFGRGAA